MANREREVDNRVRVANRGREVANRVREVATGRGRWQQGEGDGYQEGRDS